MPSLQEWDPFTKHVQGGLREGNFVNSQFVVVCAGPPFWAQMTKSNGGAGLSGAAQASGLPVYPVGVTQSFSMGQSKAVQRIFEIGSDRSYFITGRTVGQVSLGRIMYHGPSLLRCMYAFFDTSNDSTAGAYKISPLIPKAEAGSIANISPLDLTSSPQVPFSAGGGVTQKSIKIPPGYDNLFCNLASDLFSQPFGLLLMMKDNNGATYGAFYLEQCYMPQHSWGFEANGMVVSEQTSIQYERLVPVQTGQIKLLQDISFTDPSRHAPDMTGGYNAGMQNTTTV